METVKQGRVLRVEGRVVFIQRQLEGTQLVTCGAG